MQISVTEEGEYSVIALSGKLDTDTAVKADSVFSEALNKRNHLLVDLSALRYISSAGLRILLLTAKRIQRNNGRIVLFGLQDNVNEIFEISGFSSLFRICKDRGTAAAALKE